MILQPLLLALALGAGRGPDSAALPGVSYRATAVLDERARVLRGTVEIVVRDFGARVVAGLRLRARNAVVRRLLATPALAVADAGASAWTFAPGGGGSDSLVLQIDFTAADLSHADPLGSVVAPGGDRRFDFRGWLPAVVSGPEAVPLVGSFLVRLELAEDQVIAATGVPLCGDPGWSRARRPPGRPVTLLRNAYAAARDPVARDLPPEACTPSAPGRKVLTWYAENVRDFALILDPDFRYEEGDLLERPVRGLFAPGSERTWGAGLAVRRAETALAWLHEVFDTAPAPRDPLWPQTTLVHGHPGSPARADPMLVAPDSSDRESIVLQLGRLYLASAIAVGQADSAWLDEGLARFQRDLYAETQGRRRIYARLERLILENELAGNERPVLAAVGTRPDRDAAQRAEFLFYQLRRAAGEEAMRAILRAYWASARLGVGSESLFVALADSIAGGDLGRRFAAALRESEPVDYAIGAVQRVPLTQGRWRTAIEVRRRGSGQFPVQVRVDAGADTAWAWAAGDHDRDTVVVETAFRPGQIVLDPDGHTHDWNVLNNRRATGLHLGSLLPVDNRLGGYFSTPAPRDRLVRLWAPVAWYNDGGGWTFGVRTRDDYLGRFDLDLTSLTVATGAGAQGARRHLDWHVVVRNPTWLRAPGLSERFEAGWIEGRGVANAAMEWSRGARGGTLSLAMVDAHAAAYLDSAVYERAVTYELTAGGVTRTSRPLLQASAGFALTGGYAIRHSPALDGSAGEPYARIVVQATGERALGRVHVRARAWGGTVLARGAPLRQRRVYLAGADPYELLPNPFLRSRGALFLRPGFRYHAPGGAGLRGLDPTLGSRQAYALNLELERDLLGRGERGDRSDRGDRGDGSARGEGLVRRLALAAFGDGVLGDGDLDPARLGGLRPAADGGVGLRLDQRIGATTFQIRVDLPLWVSAPLLAQDQAPGRRRLGWRWTCSLTPSF